MGCTVQELLDRIDSHELTEWEAYEGVAGPLGDERLDHLFAILQSTLANLNRGKGQRPYKPEQFMPEWGHAAKQPGPMSPDDMLRAIKRANKNLGGREVGAGGDAS